MTTAIAEYSPTEAKLAELKQQYGAAVWVINTPEQLSLARKARADIRGWRVDLEAERKKIKQPALNRCRDIDSEAKRITEELLKLEGPVDEAIKKEEGRKEAERLAKAAAETARLEKARSEIEDIRARAHGAVGAESALIRSAIKDLVALDVARTDEFSDAANAAKVETLTKLRDLEQSALAHEAEQAKIAAEREELARLRAEQERAAKAEAEKRAKIEVEARAKIEAEEREAKARIAEQERAARIEREKADSEARILRAKADAEALAARRTEETRLADERARLAEEQRKADAKKRADDDAKAEKIREAQRIRAEKGDARSLLAVFRAKYATHAEFAAVVAAIDKYFDSHPTPNKEPGANGCG